MRKLCIAQDDVTSAAVSRVQPDRLAKARERAIGCARIAEENRGREIVVVDMRQVTSLVDFFVVVSASSRRQARAIAIEIDMAMKRLGEKKLGQEGNIDDRWILIDYGDFVVHIFSEDARAYYELDDLWGDAARVEWHDDESDRPRSKTIGGA